MVKAPAPPPPPPPPHPPRPPNVAPTEQPEKGGDDGYGCA